VSILTLQQTILFCLYKPCHVTHHVCASFPQRPPPGQHRMGQGGGSSKVSRLPITAISAIAAIAGNEGEGALSFGGGGGGGGLRLRPTTTASTCAPSEATHSYKLARAGCDGPGGPYRGPEPAAVNSAVARADYSPDAVIIPDFSVKRAWRGT
jgi:hypothetical protein